MPGGGGAIEILILLIAYLAVMGLSRRPGTADRPLLADRGARSALPGRAVTAAVDKVVVEPVTRLGNREGIKVVATVRVEEGFGVRLRYRVEFTHPDGSPVAARAARYKSASGAVASEALTRPIENDPAVFPGLWIFLPFGAFDLPPGLHDLVVRFSLALGAEPVAEGRAAFSIVHPGAPELERSRVDPEAMSITGAGERLLIQCRVCNEGLKGLAYLCPSCAAPHHLDCWQYNQGCSVYGCGDKSSPRLPEGLAEGG